MNESLPRAGPYTIGTKVFGRGAKTQKENVASKLRSSSLVTRGGGGGRMELGSKGGSLGSNSTRICPHIA